MEHIDIRREYMQLRMRSRLDLFVRVIDDTFVTGIYHNVDDFNF